MSTFCKSENMNKKINTMIVVIMIVPLTFATRDHRHSSRATAYAKYDWFLNPGDQEMSSLTTHCWKNSTETIKYHSSLSTVNYNRNTLTHDLSHEHWKTTTIILVNVSTNSLQVRLPGLVIQLSTINLAFLRMRITYINLLWTITKLIYMQRGKSIKA